MIGAAYQHRLGNERRYAKGAQCSVAAYISVPRLLVEAPIYNTQQAEYAIGRRRLGCRGVSPRHGSTAIEPGNPCQGVAAQQHTSTRTLHETPLAFFTNRRRAGGLMEEMDVHLWFGLSYASWLTIPRIVMESMPLRWQYAMVALLNEMDETFDWMPDDLRLYVTARKGSKFVALPSELCDYRHGSVEHLRRHPPAAEQGEGQLRIAQQANTAICPKCGSTNWEVNETFSQCHSCGWSDDTAGKRQ